jgi:hypothetical protein
MRVMTAPPFMLPADRPLTVADLDVTPDDGCRYELDDGVLVVSPAPVTTSCTALSSCSRPPARQSSSCCPVQAL